MNTHKDTEIFVAVVVVVVVLFHFGFLLLFYWMDYPETTEHLSKIQKFGNFLYLIRKLILKRRSCRPNARNKFRKPKSYKSCIKVWMLGLDTSALWEPHCRDLEKIIATLSANKPTMITSTYEFILVALEVLVKCFPKHSNNTLQETFHG